MSVALPERDPAPTPSDRQLLSDAHAAAGGDIDALGRLYERYADPLFRYVLESCGGNRAAAEDAAAEAWLKAARNIRTFEPTGHGAFAGWLWQIARNHLADTSRRRGVARRNSVKASMSVMTTDITGAPIVDRSHTDQWSSDPASQACEADQAHRDGRAIQDALKALPRAQRQVVTLRFFHGLTLAETGTIIGRTTEAVKQLQHRALRDLAHHLPLETTSRFTGSHNVRTLTDEDADGAQTRGPQSGG